MNVYRIEILIVIITKIKYKSASNIINELLELSVIILPFTIQRLLLTTKRIKFLLIDIKLPTILISKLIKAHQSKQTANNQSILS